MAIVIYRRLPRNRSRPTNEQSFQTTSNEDVVIHRLYDNVVECARQRFAVQRNDTDESLTIAANHAIGILFQDELGLAVPLRHLNSSTLLTDLVDVYLVTYFDLQRARQRSQQTVETPFGNVAGPFTTSELLGVLSDSSEDLDYRAMTPEAYDRAIDRAVLRAEQRGDIPTGASSSAQPNSTPAPPAPPEPEWEDFGVWDDRTGTFRLPRNFPWWKAAMFTPNGWTQFMKDGWIPQHILNAVEVPTRPPESEPGNDDEGETFHDPDPAQEDHDGPYGAEMHLPAESSESDSADMQIMATEDENLGELEYDTRGLPNLATTNQGANLGTSSNTPFTYNPDLYDVARLQMPHHLTDRQASAMTPAEWWELEVTNMVPERIFQMEPHPMGVPHRTITPEDNANQDENLGIDNDNANAHHDENPGNQNHAANTS